MATRLLTLDTLAERATVRIDGADYEMQTPEDFGLADLARIQRLQADLSGLTERTDLDDAEIASLVNVLDAFTQMVLPGMPDDVRNRLRDGQKLAIIRAFQAATETMRAAATPKPNANPPI